MDHSNTLPLLTDFAVQIVTTCPVPFAFVSPFLSSFGFAVVPQVVVFPTQVAFASQLPSSSLILPPFASPVPLIFASLSPLASSFPFPLASSFPVPLTFVFPTLLVVFFPTLPTFASPVPPIFASPVPLTFSSQVPLVSALPTSAFCHCVVGHVRLPPLTKQASVQQKFASLDPILEVVEGLEVVESLIVEVVEWVFAAVGLE